MTAEPCPHWECGPWVGMWRVNGEPGNPMCLGHVFIRCSVCGQGVILSYCKPGVAMADWPEDTDMGRIARGTVKWAEEERR